jgi:hypothetical protein
LTASVRYGDEPETEAEDPPDRLESSRGWINAAGFDVGDLAGRERKDDKIGEVVARKAQGLAHVAHGVRKGERRLSRTLGDRMPSSSDFFGRE